MIEGLKPYPEYKDSGLPWVGKIPLNWDVRRMKFLLREVDSRSTSGKEQLLRVSQYTCVTQRRAIDGSDEPDTRASSLVGYKRVVVGDLVINIMLAWNGSMGVSRYEGIASPAYCVYRFQSGAQPWYYHELLRLPVYKGRIKTASTGVVESRLRLYSDDLGRIEAIFPPREEQDAIVRFLDYANRRIERYIRAKGKLIALLNEQKQAIIHRAVTRGLDPNVRLKPSGIPWLGEIPEHWEIRKLGHIARVFNGTTPSRMQPRYWMNGSIPWLSSGKVNDYVVREPSELITMHAVKDCSLSMAPRGSVILGMIGQGKTRGMSALLEIDACINQNLAAIMPGQELDSRFLHYILTGFYRHIREFGRGGNQEALNCEIIGSLRLPLPPQGEQVRMVDSLNTELLQVNEAITRTEREVALIHEYWTRLVADVVTGQLDVRAVAAKLPAEPREDDIESVEESTEDEGELSEFDDLASSGTIV